MVNRAIAKRPYFETRSDKRYFLSRLAREVRAQRIEVHAFCLLTTHFHLLVRSPSGELSEAMRRAQCAYSRHFNRRRRRDGPLIRARYFSKRIDSALYWRAVVRYIDENPLRAGIARSSGEYEFCSARSFMGRRRPPWLASESIERRALEITAAGRFSPDVYSAAFGPRCGEDVDSLCEVIESRMRSARELDPLEDLVGATPPQVRAWMRRKAKLADGMRIGLPVCGVGGLRRAIELELAKDGEWFLEREGAIFRGSELAWFGLSRSLCAVTAERLGRMTSRSPWRVRKFVAAFAELLSESEEHARRVDRIVRAALMAAHPLDL